MKFASGGMLGDFIHQLFVVKNLCELNNEKADLFISENIGDSFSFSIEKTYQDLFDLVKMQPYINDFKIGFEEDCINLSNWRKNVLNDFQNGGYKKSWSELLTLEYNFKIPDSEKYKWIFFDEKNKELEDTILIHSSNKRINPYFKYDNLLKQNISFLVSSNNDFYIDGYKKYEVNNIYDMAILINSCKYFIGNQSAPFGLANALDVKRLGVLDLNFENYIFYQNEINYSKNIKTFIK
jgi:hypothetical protein